MSLLLDALKKAAQDKLEKQAKSDRDSAATQADKSGSSAPEQTELDATQLEEATQLEHAPQRQPDVNQQSTDATTFETEIEDVDASASAVTEVETRVEPPVLTPDDDATEVEAHDEQQPQIIQQQEQDQTLTETISQATEIEDNQDLPFNADETQIESPDPTTAPAASHADNASQPVETNAETQLTKTELELEPFEPSTTDFKDGISTTQFNRERTSILASELEEFLNDNDHRAAIEKYSDESPAAPTPSPVATEKNVFFDEATSPNEHQSESLTQNWHAQKAGPVSDQQQAAQLFANKAFGPNNRNRMTWLIVIMVLAFVAVAGLYAFDYISKFSDSSIVINQKPRLSTPTQQQPVATRPDDTVDPELLIEQEDYGTILKDSLSDETISSTPPAAPKKPRQTANNRSRNLTTNTTTARRTDNVSSQGQFSIRKTQRREPLQDIIGRGYRAYNNGELDTAEVAYRQALARAPKNRDTLLGLAAISMSRAQYGEARQLYQKLLELNPKDDLAIAGLSTLSQQPSTDTVSEESRIKLLLSEKPSSAHLHFTLGNIYAGERNWAEAQQAYFNAYRLEAENPDYIYNLAVSLDHLGQKSEAARFYDQALNLASQRKAFFDKESVTERLNALRPQEKTDAR